VNKESAKVQQFVYLPGGVSATLDAAATSRTWSFPNLHGHVTATSNDNGDRLTSVVYDPWGVALNPAPNNVSGTADLGAYGGNGKLTESTTTKAVTHMGARPYTASTARFLTVDPIHGGCANHYVYGFGDPLNAQDLTGKGIFDWADDLWDATGGKVASWVNDNACGIAKVAGYVSTGLAVAAFATGFLAPVAAGYLALGAAGLGVTRMAAGSIAGDRGHVVGGGIQAVTAGVASIWAFARVVPDGMGPSGLARYLAAGGRGAITGTGFIAQREISQGSSASGC
jgi:RHS repeat-associated protein